MRSPNNPRSSCSLQQTPSSQFHQTQAEAQVTDIAFLVLPQPMALTGCVHSSSFQKVALDGHSHVQPKRCENGCHVLRKFDRRNRSPGSGELRCFLSIPGNNSFIWWDKTWCFKFLQFNLESKNQRAFSEHQRNIVSFINFKPTIPTRHRFLCRCCTNHSPQPNPITLLLTCPLILTLMSRWGLSFRFVAGVIDTLLW